MGVHNEGGYLMGAIAGLIVVAIAVWLLPQIMGEGW